MWLKGLLAASIATVTLAGAAAAVPVERLVYKLTDVATPGTPLADEDGSWLGTGAFNDFAFGASDLANNGIDYKDSWVDTNWGIVEKVRTSMYRDGVEVAWIDFAPGTSKADFFSLSNVINSTWGPNVGVGGNFFSIPGDTFRVTRNWFVQNNYGGCSIDEGWFVVLAAGGRNVCTWEATGRSATGNASRGFVYSLVSNDHGDQNDLVNETGVADMFAIHVTYDDGVAPIPLPASALLLLGGLGALGAWRRLG